MPIRASCVQPPAERLAGVLELVDRLDSQRCKAAEAAQAAQADVEQLRAALAQLASAAELAKAQAHAEGAAQERHKADGELARLSAACGGLEARYEAPGHPSRPPSNDSVQCSTGRGRWFGHGLLFLTRLFVRGRPVG